MAAGAPCAPRLADGHEGMSARGDGDEPADGGSRAPGAAGRDGGLDEPGGGGHRPVGGDDTDGHLPRQRTPRASPPAVGPAPPMSRDWVGCQDRRAVSQVKGWMAPAGVRCCSAWRPVMVTASP